MVDYSSASLDRSFYALSDPTRRAILARIAKEDLTVSELAAPFAMSLAAVSKHLQVLEKAKFVKKTKAGRIISCRATLEPLQEMTKVLEDLGRYWNSKLDSLERYLANEIENGEENEQRSHKANTSSHNSASGKGKKR